MTHTNNIWLVIADYTFYTTTCRSHKWGHFINRYIHPFSINTGMYYNVMNGETNRDGC